MSWGKVFLFFWPFLKEMVLGEKSVQDAVTSNKLRLVTLGLILMSLALNMFTIPKLVSVTQQYLDLRHQYQNSQDELVRLKKHSPAVVYVPRPEAPRVPPEAHSAHTPTHSAASDEELRRQRLRERFERMQREENARRLNSTAKPHPEEITP